MKIVCCLSWYDESPAWLATVVAAAAKAGGGSAMASITIDKMIKIAHNLDMMGYYDLADQIIKI